MNLSKPKALARCHFRVEISSTEHPTSGQLRGRYHEVHDLWVDSSPDVGKLAYVNVRLPDEGYPTGEIVMCVRTIPRVRYVTLAAATKWSLKNGYRFAFPWERDAFIERLSRDHAAVTTLTNEIVDPGSCVLAHGDVHMPSIQWVEAEKPFSLESTIEPCFDIHTHFLFVKE